MIFGVLKCGSVFLSWSNDFCDIRYLIYRDVNKKILYIVYDEFMVFVNFKIS